jgi:hypothetical protein
MRARARAALSVTLAVLLLGLQPLAALAAPSNDNLADATSVTALPFHQILDVSEATVEPAEPEPWCAPISNTVWYRIELPKKTGVVVDTAGSTFDTVLAVYDANLHQITCNDDMEDPQARLGFEASRHTTYYLQAGAYDYDWYEDEEGFEPEYGEMELVLSIEAGKLPQVKPKPERFSFRGRFAHASDGSYDGGTWRETYLSLMDGRYDRETIQEVYLSTFEEIDDPEKGTWSFTEWWGYAPLTNGAIDRKLDDAYVDQQLELSGYTCRYPENGENGENGNGEWEDENSCWSLGTVVVDLDVMWTGYGQLTRVRDHYTETGPWGTYRDHYRAVSREAFVQGGAFGDGVDIDLDDAYGRLADVRSSSMWRPARR